MQTQANQQSVNQPASPQTSQPSQTPSPAPIVLARKFPWLAVIITVVVLAAVGFLTWQNWQLRQEVKDLQQSQADQTSQSANQPESTNVESVAAIPTPDPTADWKVYENKEYGFRFKHPNLVDDKYVIAGPATGNHPISKTFADPSTGIPGTDAPFAGIGVYVVADVSSFEKYINQEKTALEQQYKIVDGSDHNHQGKQIPITLAGQKGYLLKNYSWDNIDRYYVPFPGTNNILVVSLGKRESKKFGYDQILSTFEFLD